MKDGIIVTLNLNQFVMKFKLLFVYSVIIPQIIFQRSFSMIIKIQFEMIVYTNIEYCMESKCQSCLLLNISLMTSFRIMFVVVHPFLHSSLVNLGNSLAIKRGSHNVHTFTKNVAQLPSI